MLSTTVQSNGNQNVLCINRPGMGFKFVCLTLAYRKNVQLATLKGNSQKTEGSEMINLIVIYTFATIQQY